MNSIKSGSLAFLSLILFITAIFTVSSCKKDDVNPNYITLNLDGANQDSPSLPSGTYEAAARFVGGGLQNYIDYKLVEVDFFVQELPETCELIIYRSNGGSEPIASLYSANVRSGLQGDSWNNHVLTTPINVSGEDIWIAIKFSHNSDARTIGCDPGPAVPNGDWLFDSSDQQWLPLSNRSPININWNIRGSLDPGE